MNAALVVGALSVRPSGIHGYGVFANQDFAPGDIIEECYALTLKNEFELRDYSFKTDNKNSLLLGSGSLYNHANIPNASYEFYPDRSVMVFKAREFIQKDQEILIYYGRDWFGSRNAKIIEPVVSYKFKQYAFLWRMMARFGLLAAVLFIALKLFTLR
jgi:hypothetical protein